MHEENAKELLVAALFPQGDGRLLDLKFCRGRAEVISEDEFAEQVLAAMTQRSLGLAVASDTFEEDLHQVDVSALTGLQR